MTRQTVMGIDIGKQKFDVAIKVDGKYLDRKFANTEQGFLELEKWVEEKVIENLWVCMEATNVYWEALANCLHSKGHKVSVVNPSKIEAFARSQMRRNKTDKQDARLIEQFCEAVKPDQYIPLRLEVKNIQDLERYLESLKLQKTQQYNRLETQTNIAVIKSLQKIFTNIEEEIANIEQIIKEEIAKDEKLKKDNELLMTIPGIGQTTASVLLAEIGDIEKFKSIKQLDAYVGLCPSEYQSGTSVKKKSRMSKLGNSNLRKSLYLPAMSAINYNPIIKAFSSRLQSKGKAPMCIVGAAMRKLLHLAYGVLKNQLPFDPNFLQQPS